MRLILFIIVLLSSKSYLLASETKLPDHQWQSSMGGSKQMLSVRHKMLGTNRNYKAEFIVYNTDTRESYSSNILVNTDDWGEVLFPDDFKKSDGSIIYSIRVGEKFGGNFIWNCIVEADVVVGGTFSFKSSLDTVRDLRGITN